LHWVESWQPATQLLGVVQPAPGSQTWPEGHWLSIEQVGGGTAQAPTQGQVVHGAGGRRHWPNWHCVPSWHPTTHWRVWQSDA
jgi:hypothetical protein